MTEKPTTFLIWDADDKPPKGNWTTVLWRSYAGAEGLLYSMPKIVEERADALKQSYLSWIYDMGESDIEGKKMVDRLELRPGFSYWWMTLIAEKSSAHKSPRVTDALKMLALDELIKNGAVSLIILATGDKILAEAFSLWCKKAGYAFECRPVQCRTEPISPIRRVYGFLPQPLQAVISLVRYSWQRWPLKKENTCRNKAADEEITFVDYLIHMDKKALNNGRFASQYWTDLIGVLDSSGKKINWLHHYIQHEAVRFPRHGRDLILRFNQGETARQFHCFLDGMLSFSLIRAVLADYIRLLWISFGMMKKINGQFSMAGSQLNFWPLFKHDWVDSMRGPTAIWNCLCLNLFERTFSRLPRQRSGFYLQENQGWETALIYSWFKAGHGRLIGVPHSTVRFWDLRYFYDPRSYQRSGNNDLPLPTKVAVNSPTAITAYQQGGYPADQVILVEALRYLHLLDPAIRINECKNSDDDRLSILVLGDYLPNVTRRQMAWLVEAARRLSIEINYTVKPHPACPILTEDYPSLQLNMASAPLTKLLADCDVAFTSNITSAALDAYCAGVPVISMLEGEYLNMSPLRGMEGVFYVTGSKELADVLGNIRKNESRMAKSYFCLEKELPRWRQLLLDSLQG